MLAAEMPPLEKIKSKRKLPGRTSCLHARMHGSTGAAAHCSSHYLLFPSLSLSLSLSLSPSSSSLSFSSFFFFFFLFLVFWLLQSQVLSDGIARYAAMLQPHLVQRLDATAGTLAALHVTARNTSDREMPFGADESYTLEIPAAATTPATLSANTGPSNNNK